MATIRTILPSAPLHDYVRGYLYRDIRLRDTVVVRPVSAESDPRLVFTLRDSYSAFEYAPGCSRVLPDVLLVGPQTRRVADLEISGHHAALSIVFQPGGLYRLFGVSGRSLVDRAEDAALVLDPGLRSVLEILRHSNELPAMIDVVETFLLSRLGGVRPGHPVHGAALELRRSNGLADLPTLVQRSGHSVRHFDRAFLAHFGMTPKRYARVSRFGFALRLKLHRPQLTWTAVSHEAGYFDQNHLVKDFRSLVGATPGAYLKAVAAPPEPLRPNLDAP